VRCVIAAERECVALHWLQGAKDKLVSRTFYEL
jgi:hypothetical protein